MNNNFDDRVTTITNKTVEKKNTHKHTVNYQNGKMNRPNKFDTRSYNGLICVLTTQSTVVQTQFFFGYNLN